MIRIRISDEAVVDLDEGFWFYELQEAEVAPDLFAQSRQRPFVICDVEDGLEVAIHGGSKAIYRVSNVLLSPSPDPSRSHKP